jgi:DhnA family fructose-bisphosphate aldolase class Ia
MHGKLLRFDKLFSRNENAVVIAVDHGMFDGPIPGLEDVRQTLRKINPAVDAVLMSPGILKQCPEAFNFKGAPIPVVRVNWSTVYCFHWQYQRAVTVPACSVREAVALGAEIVLISLTLKTGDEAVDAKNVEVFARLIEEARQLGIPAVGEFFPTRSDALTPEEMHEQVMCGTRIIAELGADLIKTFFTKDFSKVTASCPVPILGLGAEKKPTQVEALQLARDEIAAGAKGVVFGRNAFQVADPQGFQAALCDVVKRGAAPQQAAGKYKLKDAVS